VRRKLKEAVVEINKYTCHNGLDALKEELRREIARVWEEKAGTRAAGAEAGGDDAFAGAKMVWGKKVEELLHKVILKSAEENPGENTTKVKCRLPQMSPHRNTQTHRQWYRLV
jgi:hypothetical protein